MNLGRHGICMNTEAMLIPCAPLSSARNASILLHIPGHIIDPEVRLERNVAYCQFISCAGRPDTAPPPYFARGLFLPGYTSANGMEFISVNRTWSSRAR